MGSLSRPNSVSRQPSPRAEQQLSPPPLTRPWSSDPPRPADRPQPVDQPDPPVVAELLIQQVRQEQLRIQAVPAQRQPRRLDLDRRKLLIGRTVQPLDIPWRDAQLQA